MKNVILLVVTLFLLSCTNTSDIKIHSSQDLVGVWSLKYDGQGDYWFSQLAFTEDGRKCVLSYELDPQGNVSIDYYLNKYWVEDNVLVTLVQFSSTEYVPPGYVIRDRIDSLDSNQFEVFMVQPMGTTAEKHQRLSGVDPEVICKVVSGYAHNKPL